MYHFLSVNDVAHLSTLVSQAIAFKANPRKRCHLGEGRRLGMLFLNPSLRTRISTQVAAANLGLETIVFNIDKEGWKLEFEDGAVMNGDTVEHVKDAAPVLGKYFDILAIRTFPSLKNKEEDYSENYIQQFVKYAGIPVVSLESATLHPLQSLADLVTMEEWMLNRNFTHKPKVVLTWAPHVKPLPQCVANSFAQWVNAWGKAEFSITHPEGYELDEKFTNGARIVYNQDEALKDADFIYVKNWSSYHSYGAVLPGDHSSWLLNSSKLQATNNAKVMHCLPVRRNVELIDEILDGPNSLVTEEAGNRVWAAQAVLASILEHLR
ncbi:MAG: acetylornithine carbamoyltransferase [Chitinophagaceae bacterium]|jgi:N-succinyl-L-ornithine transcarbamylase|nr:acetylornithine carbamoyltransferase [Chitinophagaceae bacterium]